MKKLLLSSLVLIASCSLFIDSLDKGEKIVLNPESKNLSILLSHNINGETHPCGCRHFPLGGLPQIAGLHEKIKKDSQIIYIDSGDMLYPSQVLPKELEKSLTFAALNLSTGLEKLGLSFFVPGDQDLAAGWGFLQDLANKSSYQFLISNLNDQSSIKHKRWSKVEKGPHRIYFLGIVDPSSIPQKYRQHFKNSTEGLKETLQLIKKDGYDQKNTFHRLIVVSHSGYQLDLELAKIFPQIDWILGSHSQKFTRFPLEQGQTKIVQVLSRNHYLGELKINLGQDKSGDSWVIHEIRSELEKKLKPNPFTEFIQSHKMTLSKLQSEEQDSLSFVSSDEPLRTQKQCLECHSKQGEFWKGTPHSLAYLSLIHAKEENNLTCLKCHSVGLGNPKGFKRQKDLVQFSENKNHNLKATKYWEQVKSSFKGSNPVRKLAGAKIKSFRKEWDKLNEKEQVEHDFANVQCLNCHEQHLEHPFGGINSEITREQKINKMQKKCLSCHDPDQSPSWYKKKENGLAGEADLSVLYQQIKKVACPREQEE